MKPLKLELEGFACYRDRQVISFDDLELFAISGPTGAGKSMLLDAITFALYGQTARLGRTNLDTLISPGFDRLEVDLQFQVAAGTFRVVRTAERRASGTVNRNTRIAQLDAAADWKQLPESERLRDADQKLLELLGLDYDGFTRSVLLPQGAFDEFLKGDAAKRRSLLTSLLGLERIERMRQEAVQRHSRATARIQELTARLDGELAAATPQQVRQLTDRLEQLQRDQERVTTELTELDTQLERQAELQHFATELADVTKTLAQLAGRADEIEQLNRNVEQGRRALALTPQLAQVRQRSEAVQQISRQTGQLQEAKDQLEPRVLQARAEAEQLAAALAEQEPALQERISSLQAVEPQLVTLEQLGGSLDAAVEHDGVSEYAAERVSSLRELRAQLPALQRATQLQAEAERGLQQARTRQEETAGLAAAAELALEKLTERGKEAREQLNEAAREYAAAQLEDSAQALRQHVHVGADCPVCGQVVATLPVRNEPQLEQLELRRAQAEQALNELLDRHREATAGRATAAERASHAVAAVQQAGAALSAATEASTASRQPFTEAGRTVDPAALGEELAAEYAGQLAALASRISNLTGGQEPRAALGAAVEARKTARRRNEAATQAVSQLEKELADLSLRLTLRSEALEEQKNELEQLESGLQQELQAAGFTSEEELRGAALSEERLAQAAEGVREHAEQLASSTYRQAELSAALQGVEYDAAAHQQLRDRRGELQQQQGSLREEAGRLQAEAQVARKALTLAREYEQERAKTEKEYGTWWQLDLDLRGSAFTAFLLSQVQQQLARRASVIIRQVTEGRYNLHLVGPDEYWISDAWAVDSGRRSVRSLSGGETFIVSLALALALSDTIAGGRALGALFLDEGFGSLDAATLESVAQVLEALTAEGRMVGIITHVSELTERLPARLVVRKEPRGSTVHWED